MQLICILALFLILPTSLAALANVTIDDVQITYLPENAWHSGPDCEQCVAKIDPSRVHNGTWHEGAFGRRRRNSDVDTPQSPLIASVSFYGRAVYVYCVIANTERHPNGNVELTFLIDHQEMGSFSREPPKDPTGPFEYNVPVFAATTLPQGNHTLTITNGHTDGPRSLLILDYIIYSRDSDLPDSTVPYRDGAVSPTVTPPPPPLLPPSPPPSPSPSSQSLSTPPTGKIIGGVLGSIACLLLILVAFLFRRQQKSQKPHELPAPVSTSGAFLPGEYISRWFQKTPFSKSPVNSHFSFNPSLLVLPIRNRARSHSQAPSPIAPSRSKNKTHDTHHPHRPLDPVLLAPLPPPTTNRLSPSILDTHTHLAADSGHPLSISEWRRQTQWEADAIPPRFDMSEVDLSSYYESDSYHSPPPDHPPPKPIVRRFTVVNT